MTDPVIPPRPSLEFDRKHFVEISALSPGQKIERFLSTVCSNDVFFASQMLRVDDAFTQRDVSAAAAAGNTAAVKAFLSDDSSCVHTPGGPLYTTPLVYACQSRLLVTDPARREDIVEVARLLLEAGADPNTGYVPEGGTDPDDRKSPLYGAAGIANHAGLTRLLLGAGADPNDGLKGKPSETLYHVAEFADTTCLRMVLESGPDQVAIDYCLGRALDFKRPDAALLFVEFDADVEHRVSWFDNRTHLMKAIRNDADLPLVSAMVQRATDLGKTDDNGLNAYRHAVRAGRADITELLARHGVKVTGGTPVDRALGACMQGDVEALAGIRKEHPNLALEDFDREMLPFAARQMDTRAVPLLIELGIPIDFSGGNMPALHEVCFCGDFESVKQLLDLGASLEVVNAYGGTALSAAVYGSTVCHDHQGGPRAEPPESVEPRGYAKIVELLIERGAALPDQEAGSRAVIEVLQRYGVGAKEP